MAYSPSVLPVCQRRDYERFPLIKSVHKKDWSGSNLGDDAMCLECVIGSSCGSGIFHTIYTTIER